MKRLAEIILFLWAILALSSANSLAQVIETDPNTPQAAAEQEADDSDADPRLAQKITYTATGKRLHTVLEELTAMTGVTIRCGSGEDDWKVRDLPVLVCCKDYPLGNLLKAIAESTHMLLSSYSIDGTKSYRVWWDKSRQAQLDVFYKARHEAALENASREWDAWVKLTSISDEALRKQFTYPESEPPGAYELAETKCFARILELLGPGAKQQLLAGEPLCVNAQHGNPAIAEAFVDFYRAYRQCERELYREYYSENPEDAYSGFEDEVNREVTDDEIRQACLGLSLSQDVMLGLDSTILGPSGGQSPAILSSPLDFEPDEMESPDPPTSDYIRGLRKVEMRIFEDDEPVGDDTIKLSEYKGDDDPRFSDIVTALSEASGYAFVCEDFFSSKDFIDDGSVLFGRKTTMDKVLSSLERGYMDSIAWYADDAGKLIIGYSGVWYEHHDALVAESYINSLRDKLNGDGVRLDDCLSILRLTNRQYTDWIRDSSGLDALHWVGMMDGRSLWTFYEYLSEADKARAASDSGLPLAKFDPRTISDILQRVGDNQWMSADGFQGVFCCEMDDDRGDGDILTDPETVSGLTLYLRVDEMSYPPMLLDPAEMQKVLADLQNDPEFLEGLQQVGMTIDEWNSQMQASFKESMRAQQNPQERKSYYFQLKGEGVDTELARLWDSFPIYSKKREKQLRGEPDDAAATPNP